MAHRCTGCGRTFENGSKEMLTGCPDCDGNAFQYVPDGGVATEDGGTNAEGGDMAADPTPNGQSTKSAVTSSTSSSSEAERTQPTQSADTEANAPVEDASQADARSGVVDTDELTDREWPAVSRPDSERSPNGPNPTSGRTNSNTSRSTPPEPVADTADTTDSTAAPTDSTADTSDQMADATDSSGTSETSDSVEPQPSPDVEEVRTELNDQFESIRIVEPGQYELNLMELYERDEYIIQLQENGRYVIEALDGWQE